MVAGSEVARMIADDNTRSHQKDSSHHHHEQHPGVQATFIKDFRSLSAVVEEMGRPFLEESEDFLILDTRDIINGTVCETGRNVEILGEEQYHRFVKERLVESAKPITEPLHKNRLPLFSRQSAKPKARHKRQIALFKNDCTLFSRLYISCQSRDRNLDQFFTHENQAEAWYKGRHPPLS